MRSRDLPLRALTLVAAFGAMCAKEARASEGARAEENARPSELRSTLHAPLRAMTLDEVLAEARLRHPTFRLTKNLVRRAEALVEQARAASLPTLAANGAYTRLDDDRVLGGRLLASGNQFQGNAQLIVPIVAARAWFQWRAAEDARDVAEANAKESERQFAVAVARTYLAVLGQRRLVEVAERSRDNAREHHAFAKTRFEGGVGNRLDEARAHQALASADAALEGARLALDRLREALGVLVGVEGPVDVTDDVALGGRAEAEAIAADGVDQRTDVAALRRAHEAASRVVRASWVDFLPLLSAAFQPFLQEPSTATQPEVGWQAQLLFTLPLFDGGQRYGVHAERKSVARDAELRLEIALAQARSDLRIAVRAVQQVDRSLLAAREASKLAGESFALAAEAYRAGATNNLEVIDAERRARDAETQVAVAEDAARQARLELLVAAGRFP
jgi:outer membrane protein TolC